MGDLQRVKRTSLRANEQSDERMFGGLSVFILIVATMLGVMGWQYRKQIDVKTIRVSGAVMSEASEIIRLAAVDTSAALYSIDPTLVEDRIKRHPWVRKARLQRLPTGTLKINVSERIPVMLVIQAKGRPSHYLDAECYQMPLASVQTFDVPLVSGSLPEYHPVKQVDNRSVCQLASTVAIRSRVIDRIASEFVVDQSGNVTLYTKPTNGYTSIPVYMGDKDFSSRITKLSSFWEQIVSKPERKMIKKIDLRFDSQIVTE